MASWVNFKQLKEQIKFEDVLTSYRVEIKAKGNQHLGFCPLPGHEGTRRSPSFSANLTKGIFNCFGCGAQGNLIDFVALMERLNPEDGTDVRKAALILKEKFRVGEEKPQAMQPKGREIGKPPAVQAELKEDSEESPSPPVVVNSPLDFELKNLDPHHSYLDTRGFDAETIRLFGLGYCSKGLLSGRIAIPIHDQSGQLVGYAGRLVDNTKICEEHPKYRFPGKRERGGSILEFHKLLLLYNANRVKGPVSELFVVEGMPSVWWLTQMGFPNVVALMGSVCSPEQAKIIIGLVETKGRVWLVPDADDAGKRFALELFERVAPDRFVQWIKLDPGKQPTDYPAALYRQRLKK